MAIRPRQLLACAIAALIAGVLLGAASARAETAANGGASFEALPPPPSRATIVNGRAVAPVSAPARVKRVIAAANRIVNKPYVWGGGHAGFGKSLARGYDCSGAVSHALHGGRFLRSPLASGGLTQWGRSGPGQWITVYAHSSHAYVVVAGLRFDTSMRDANAPGPATGPRWSKTLRGSAAFIARHPRGF